ncbi:MAG: TIGR00282 family metallophosphoesterase [Rhodospirillales bacterium]|nr:TIGR00282 family metallophosphoesterase [Rhodospirillales bacterium]MCB9973542.1 TIGR00282 family metallophosphoesterase [Rhodospirillales bacterium]
MKLIFIGDVYGRSGRDALIEHLPPLIKQHDVDFVIVNGENAAHGRGITKDICKEMFDAGADCITSGDHIWDQREMIAQINNYKNVLRPVNLPDGAPGNGIYKGMTKNGKSILIVNAMGRTFMEPIECPFRRMDLELKNYRLGQNIDAIFVDFHAEATSEKVAFGHYLDGRVSAVVGTHTHIPTADAHILEHGTAYQTDAGMTGDYDSVIGRRKDISIYGFLRKMPGEKPQPATGPGTLCGALITIDDQTGLARAIDSFKVGGCLAV